MKNIKLYKSLIISIILGVVACKKAATPIDEEMISPTTGTRTEFTLDSVFLYARQIYLWSDVLPDYSAFNPRVKYGTVTPVLTAFRKELFDLSQLKLNPVTQTPYELPVYSGTPKYSYIQAGRSTGGSVADVSGSAGTAIVKSTVINHNGQSVAYIALNSFPKLSAEKSAIDAVFNEIAAARPKYLVIDLRDNGGGYTETAEYFANQIAASALNGKLMYSEQFNSKMQLGEATILKHQPYLDVSGNTVSYQGRLATMADVDYSEKGNSYYFDKKGSLETLEKVYFIVSGKTASASEMLISCLKPYMEVKLIGEKTYGKPVGFFAINIDQYSLYLSSFLIRNAAGWSDYFTGMPPDVTVSGSANPDLGNPEESCLKAALALIGGNTTETRISSVKLQQTKASTTSKQITTDAETGVFETRLKLKH